MIRRGFGLIAVVLVIQPGFADAFTKTGLDAPGLSGASIPIMGDRRPIRVPSERPPKVNQDHMGLYIVTYDCPGKSPDQIVQSIAGGPYKIVKRMQFTQQFVVEASSSAISSLKRNNCVISIQKDTPSAPAAG